MSRLRIVPAIVAALAALVLVVSAGCTPAPGTKGKTEIIVRIVVFQVNDKGQVKNPSSKTVHIGSSEALSLVVHAPTNFLGGRAALALASDIPAFFSESSFEPNDKKSLVSSTTVYSSIKAGKYNLYIATPDGRIIKAGGVLTVTTG